MLAAAFGKHAWLCSSMTPDGDSFLSPAVN